MVTQSFTFFFTPDVTRATDRSQNTLWVPSTSLSSTSAQGISWVKPLR